MAPAGLSRAPVDRAVSSGWIARCSDDAVLGLLRRCVAVAGGAVDGRTAATTGSGPATVMLLNDSGNSVCRSLPLAAPLADTSRS